MFTTTRGAVLKLATERKRLTSLLKMVAYQVESDLVDRIRPWFRRVDQEGFMRNFDFRLTWV